MNPYTLQLVTAPAVEPVSLAEAKLWLRVDGSDEDDLISSLIVAARQQAEKFTGRQLINATWRMGMDRFPCHFIMPLAPLSSVTSITYVDANGVTQTLSASTYTVDTMSQPGRIVPANTTWPDWPGVKDTPNAVLVNFVAGYGAAGSAVPDPIRVAIRQMLATWFKNRESVGPSMAIMPQAAEYLLWPFRVWGRA